MKLVLFARAREVAGRAADEFEAGDLESVLLAAGDRYGDDFVAVLATARVWVNGDEPADGLHTALRDGDEVAVLPPVSGG